jgi:hypothetical protein
MLIDSDDNNRILLTDFGIAKLAGIRGLTKSGTTIGTAEYMSPEQAEGREVDGRADIYSLGCVLYEALAGRAPFVGSTPVSVLYQQVHARPDYIRALNPQVPRELARVLDMALAKQPEDRFDSAETFAQAVQPFTIGFDRGTPPGFTRRAPQSAPLPGAPLTVPPLAPGLAAQTRTRPSYPQAPLHGLGTEGLDALFPDDPEARMAARHTAPPPAPYETPTVPGAAAYSGEAATAPNQRAVSASGPRPTIPLKALNSQPLTADPPSDGMLPAAAAEATATVPGTGVEDLPTVELPPLQPAAAAAAPRTRRAAVAAPPRRSPPRDAPRPARSNNAPPPRNRPWARAVVILAILAALGVVWIGARAAAAQFAQQPTHVGARQTAVATTAPTTVPTAAPTLAPTPATTATPSPQQIADAQAAAAFRSITVYTAQDGACSSTTPAFTPSQAISVNLCVAPSAHSGVISVQLRQGGAVLTTMAQGVSILPGYWYSWTTHSRPAGSYDMLVTYNNGTAADITFTVA